MQPQDEMWREVLKWMGWKQLPGISPLDNRTPIILWMLNGKLHGSHPPLTLDTLHEAEEKLTDEQAEEYCNMLAYDLQDPRIAQFNKWRLRHPDINKALLALWRTIKTANNSVSTH